MTGISFINSQLGPKRIQLQRLLNSKTGVIAVLVNPKNPNAADAKAFVAAGRSIGVDIVIVNASTEPKIKQALDRAVQQHADALLVHVDALFNDGRGQEQIVALAGQHRLPSMMATPPSRRGASYGADTSELNQWYDYASLTGKTQGRPGAHAAGAIQTNNSGKIGPDGLGRKICPTAQRYRLAFSSYLLGP